MVTTFFIATFLVACSLASPVQQDCSATLKAAGASDRFPGVVAHGIHSITVEQLRKFKPDVTEKNSVPTVNKDLISDQPLLLNAPNEPDVGKTFKTDAMRAVDQVLSHMDNLKYDVKQYGALERLVHTLHMREVWYEALVQYQKIIAKPPTAEACQCARDIEHNGIMDVLRFVALKIREPELMFGKHMLLKNGTVSWDSNAYSYHFMARKDTENLLQQKEGDTFPPLVSEAAWAQWKKVSMSMEPTDDFELALYLYCALNA